MSQRFRPLTSAPRPKRIIAIDSEDDSHGNMYYGCLHYDEGKFFDAESAEEMRELLYSRRWRGALCVCVNMEYDLASIFGEKWEGLITTFTRGGMIISKLKLRDRQGSRSKSGKKRGDEFLEFVDLLNIHRAGSVAKFGALVGIKKMTEEVKGIIGKSRDELTKTEWNLMRRYCQRDTEITYKAGVMLQDAFNDLGGDFGCTIGKVALSIYRRKYQRVSYNRLSPERIEYLHDAFYGGRTEAFRIGRIKKKMYFADVNSMYPFTMTQLRFPDPDSIRMLEKIEKRHLKYPGITHATVHVPLGMTYPPLPVVTGDWPERIEEGSLVVDQEVSGFKLVFPVGTFTGCWCNNELRHALSLPGVRIVRYFDGCVFDRADRYLRRFAMDIYRKRQEAKTPIENTVLKLCLNSLFGKFAQRGSKTILMDIDDFDAAALDEEGWKDQWETTSMWPPSNPRFVMQSLEVRAPIHTNIIWSAMITAQARVMLHKLLVKYQGIYCDTDSVITMKPVKSSKKLGALKIEKVLNEIEIVAPKHYRYRGRGERKWETVCKGVPKKKHGDVFRPRKGGVIKVTYQRPYKIREALRRDKKMNEWRDITKIISARYDKRIILPGGRTRPIRVKEVAVG